MERQKEFNDQLLSQRGAWDEMATIKAELEIENERLRRKANELHQTIHRIAPREIVEQMRQEQTQPGNSFQVKRRTVGVGEYKEAVGVHNCVGWVAGSRGFSMGFSMGQSSNNVARDRGLRARVAQPHLHDRMEGLASSKPPYRPLPTLLAPLLP